MKIIKFIRSVFKDFIKRLLIVITITFSILLTSIVLSLLITEIPIIIYCIFDYNVKVLALSLFIEVVLLCICNFICNNGENVIKYFKNKWREVNNNEQ